MTLKTIEDTTGLAQSYAKDPHCDAAVLEAKSKGLVPGTPSFLSFVIHYINQFPYIAPKEAFSDGSLPGKERRVEPDLPTDFKATVSALATDSFDQFMAGKLTEEYDVKIREKL